jgi:3-oxoacyl-[acyl-carrier-protein] synthase-1
MACPELLPNKNSRVETSFFENLKAVSQCNIDINNSRRIAMGRAGGFAALDIAYKYFQATGHEFALIGGVDSYRHFNNQIDALDKEHRLMSEGVADGFVIGEGASFLLLASPAAIEKYALQPKLFLGQPACTQEVGHRYNDAPYRGDGLAHAFTQALAAAPQLPIHRIYSSLNGESFGTKELGVARIRNSTRLGSHIHIEHPADCFGDLGAAMAPMLFSLVAHNEKKPCLVYSSADGADRGAVCAWQPIYNNNFSNL